MVATGNALAGIQQSVFPEQPVRQAVGDETLHAAHLAMLLPGRPQSTTFRVLPVHIPNSTPRDVLSVCSGKDETVFSRPLLTRDGNVNFVANKKRQVLCT